MHGNEYESHISATKKYISQPMKQKTWKRVNRNDIPPGPDGKSRRVLKSTWAFKLKLPPDIITLKYKARYCVCGDIQKESVDYS